MLSEEFWNKILELNFISVDEVKNIVSDNDQNKVPLPENILLRTIQSLDNKKRIENEKRHLLPKRYEEEFFIADGIDIPYARDDIASMEYPIFALKAGDVKDVIYEHNGFVTHIKPNSAGRATIFDKDVWIYAISKLMQAKYLGLEIQRSISFTTRDFLIQTNRPIGGSQYEQFKQSLDRLTGTRIMTEVKTGEKSQTDFFGLIESATVISEDKQGRSIGVQIVLPEWLYQSIIQDGVLTISKEYFRLRKPIDRRIYELARKHCGKQPDWKISIDLLHKKTGATMSIREFRRSINSLIKSEVFPDYAIKFERATDTVHFINLDAEVQRKANIKAIRKIAKTMS